MVHFNKSKLVLGLFTSISSLATMSLDVNAASRSSVLEEVIVTAQKREQNSQDVGIAISAMSGEQMEALGFSETTDVINFTSGVNFTGSTAGQHKMFNIRGVAQQDYNDTSESPNAVYIDETYLAATYLQRFGMFDMERVEVLKGPQGTLFGRNATGGLGHFITNKPTDVFEAKLSVGYGSYNESKLEGSVSGSISDNLKGRFAMMYEGHDPIYKNDFPGADDTWDEDTWGIRAHLEWDISDDVTALFTLHRGREEISSAHYQSFPSIAVFDEHGNQIEAYRLPEGSTETRVAIQQTPAGDINACPFNNAGCFINFLDVAPGEGNFLSLPAGALGPGSPSYDIGVGVRPVPGADIDGYRDSDIENLRISSDYSVADANSYSLTGATAKFTWDIADTDIVLTSITDFKHTTKVDYLDTEGSPSNSTVFYALAKGNQWSQEIRLNGQTDRARWVAGGFYLHIKNYDVNTGLLLPPTTANGNAVNRFQNTSDLVNAGLLPVSLLPNPGQNSSIDQETESYSIFGQMDYDLTDTLVLTAGARLIREEKEYDHITQMRSLDGTVLVNDLVSIENGFLFDTLVDGEESEETLWSGKIQLDWTPNEDLLVYGGVNRGVKAGGFNAKLGTAPPVPPAFEYDPEILTAYEIGFKSTIFGGTTRFNGSAYYYDYDDNQSFQYFGLQNYVINVDAVNKGVEFDITSNPIDGLDLMFNVGYIDATLEDVPFATGEFGPNGVGNDVRLLDKKPAYTPKISYSGLARYEWDSPFSDGSLYVQYDFFYSDSYYTFVTNYEATEMEDHLVHNFRLGYTSEDRSWGVDLVLENVEDERYSEIAFEFSSICGCSDYAVSGKPRWASATVYYNWD
ncbi:TonB-dependent receptor [Pseudomaricurvus alkylphenolicus]|uniref:TonB-dependent receptor n=1 Tax=Pseudomaricurvus alkylphenolicus TaxID=1306991 RepID=UPI001F0D9F06|nr:TonB-dependent receptor [Pseudomaricurvus alkylphenolicus]